MIERLPDWKMLHWSGTIKRHAAAAAAAAAAAIPKWQEFRRKKNLLELRKRRIYPQVTGAAEVDEGVQEVEEQRNSSGGMDFWREIWSKAKWLQSSKIRRNSASAAPNCGVRK